MFLNQGKFWQNGGCGYILKPKIMRDPHETGINYLFGNLLSVISFGLIMSCSKHSIHSRHDRATPCKYTC